MRYVLGLPEAVDISLAGGKGAHLAALMRIDGVRVPPGFCVTTEAYRRRDGGADLPGDVAAAISAAVDPQVAYAVRSSATAEDLPTASFAGQQDTYLNVTGPGAVREHVRKCWASLFTERAVAYRRRHGVDDSAVEMAVVVQEMVFPDAAGILFTADPVSGNRRVVSIDAGFGLGEALVSGQVDPDVFTVRDGEIVTRTIATKQRARYARPGGGTEERPVDPARQDRPALTDAQVLRLAALGRRIEAHFGSPQDIEWCLAGDDFLIVQSRPITTLFPVPAAPDDRNRIYVSVGHQQMMTDAMRPLGWSMWQLTAMAPMHEAGGRLFVDVTERISTPAGRAPLLALMGRDNPAIRDALESVADFVEPAADQPPAAPAALLPAPPEPIPTDPALVAELVESTEASLATLRREIAEKSGPALFDYLLAAFEEHKRVLARPLNFQVIMAGMEAAWWLNDHLREWLGERNAADTLTLSAPGNITSEMGLALLDVADAVRPHPEVVAFLAETTDDGFLDALPKLPGGAEARDTIENYLDRYGMRCVGEIDITRPRWRERPTTLLPVLLDNVRNFEPGEAHRRFEQGRQQAEQKAQDILVRLRAQPDGNRKADETERMIHRLRTFVGYREYPKYGIVSRYFVYKQALLREAERLVRAGVLRSTQDAFHLTFQEFHAAVRANAADGALIARRRDEFRSYQFLNPPPVLTSDGEAVTGSHHRDDVPAGALAGLPVSAGTVEGRARVIRDLGQADLEPGDILVTAYTDPSWTPALVTVAGLVTEVGGLMTHGAVIAREYGLPAVVGVHRATQLIPDGRRIRVHGTGGYVELLP